MSMTFAQYLVRLAQNIGPVGEGVNWAVAVPQTIDYAEQRMYRELDLLATVITDNTTTTANSRNFTLPSGSGRFVTVQNMSIITTASDEPELGTRRVLTPANRKFIDLLYPSDISGTGLPEFYAMVTDQTVILGPSPDDTYNIEVTGTIRPTPLSASNTSTVLSLYLPDAFLAASMNFLCEYITMNYPGAAEVPKAQAWEAQYQALMQSAGREEMRKRYNVTFSTAAVPAPAPVGAQ